MRCIYAAFLTFWELPLMWARHAGKKGGENERAGFALKGCGHRFQRWPLWLHSAAFAPREKWVDRRKKQRQTTAGVAGIFTGIRSTTNAGATEEIMPALAANNYLFCVFLYNKNWISTQKKLVIACFVFSCTIKTEFIQKKVSDSSIATTNYADSR